MNAVDIMKYKLTEIIRLYNSKGWSPATSTNYSFKVSKDDSNFYVSKSGVDKSEFCEEDFILVNQHGEMVSEINNVKPSAETKIHATIYRLFPKTCVILHSHSIESVFVSQKFENEINFEGYEIQKGFEGQTTHEAKISVPILENSQDMDLFCRNLMDRKLDFICHSFIIKKHGTYAWGDDLFSAKRHFETLEYLIKVASKDF
jgi:methylthioribulose-1-phosphate dehydratase